MAPVVVHIGAATSMYEYGVIRFFLAQKLQIVPLLPIDFLLHVHLCDAASRKVRVMERMVHVSRAH